MADRLLCTRRMRSTPVMLAAFVLAFTACSKKANPTEAETPKPPPPPFEATFEGKNYKFLSAKIKGWGVDDAITLSTAAGGCDVESKEGDIELLIQVGQGPGGKHFAGQPLAVKMELTSEKEPFDARSLDGVVTIGEGEWKEGGKVKGVLSLDDAENGETKKLYKGFGSFEAVVCGLAADYERYQGTAVEADKAPFSGNLGATKFAFKKGMAMVVHDRDRDIDVISEIGLFESDVTCETWSEQTKTGNWVKLFGTDGARGKEVFLGTAQQRTLMFSRDGDTKVASGPAWVKFDALDFKPNSVVKGSVHFEASAPAVKADPTIAGRLSGTFSAIVCK